MLASRYCNIRVWHFTPNWRRRMHLNGPRRVAITSAIGIFAKWLSRISIFFAGRCLMASKDFRGHMADNGAPEAALSSSAEFHLFLQKAVSLRRKYAYRREISRQTFRSWIKGNMRSRWQQSERSVSYRQNETRESGFNSLPQEQHRPSEKMRAVARVREWVYA